MEHALRNAIENQEIDTLKQLLDHDEAKLIIDSLPDDLSHLIFAIRGKNPDIVEVLLNAKANPNLRNEWEETPLFNACAADRSSELIARLLIHHKADVNDAHESSLLPLVFALELKNEQLVRFLLYANASVTPPCAPCDEVLSSAVATGDLSLVNLILNEYPVNVRTIDAKVIEAAYELRRTTGSLAMLDFFLNGAGNVFKVGDKSAMSLFDASNRRDIEGLRYLLDLGAVVNDEDRRIPPMFEAVLMGFVEGVRMMIARGADVNCKIRLTNTESYLYMAACNDDLEMAKVLLEAKANPNLSLRYKPLGVAVLKNDWPMVQLLLQHGADTVRSCYDGKNAKSLVKPGQTHPQIVAALLGDQSSC